jgi:hypothetical protein
MCQGHFPAARRVTSAQWTVQTSTKNSDTDSATPAVLISPVKACTAKKTIVGKTDAEVWSLSDSKIIGTCQFSCQYYDGTHEHCPAFFRGFQVYLVFQGLQSLQYHSPSHSPS